jgi:(2Fe-2S) ferredoxin
MQRRTAEQRGRELTWVLVCTNERDSEYAACAEVGGEAVVAAVQDWLRERGMFWSDAAVVETSCLGLCSEDGTAVAFQPRDEWFSDVTPADVPALLADQLEQ